MTQTMNDLALPARKYKFVTQFEFLAKEIYKATPNECMIWPFFRNPQGYGLVRLLRSFDANRPNVQVHRLAFRLVHGYWPVPQGCHTCDNPSCFNPYHVYAGTAQDNKNDAVNRRRHAYGSRQFAAKFTEDVVASIRKEYEESQGKLTFVDLGSKYNVSAVAMRSLIVGNSWKHVGGGVSYIKAVRERPLVCKNGHTLDEQNCYTHFNRGIEEWVCRTCQRDVCARYRHKKKTQKFGIGMEVIK